MWRTQQTQLQGQGETSNHGHCWYSGCSLKLAQPAERRKKTERPLHRFAQRIRSVANQAI